MNTDMHEWSGWIPETDSDQLQHLLGNLLVKARFNLLSFTEHHFEPHGYTALWLLGESHLAVHSFPEKSLSYVHLASCNLEYFQNFTAAISDLYVIENN